MPCFLIAGSRIRAAVALITLDEFHRHSAQVIQHAIFKDPVTGKMTVLHFLITGSRIRAAVALITFDEFHRHSAQVIQHAIFKDTLTGKMTVFTFCNYR